MQLICFSVSHHNAPLEMRECISLSNDKIEHRLAKQPVRLPPFESIMEIVVLSTCNRLEMYAVVSFPEGAEDNPPAAHGLLLKYASQAFDLPGHWIEPYLRQYSGIEVVKHLYRVAAGLDSIAVGETQILGQVARAFEIGANPSQAQTSHGTPPARHVLSSLFQAAVHTGKRVRTETEIGRRPTSITTIAIQLAETKLGSLIDRNILVVGAGKIGKNTIEALQARHVQHIVLANRTDSVAVEMSARLGGTPLPYQRLSSGILAADIVITSTAAPLPIIDHALISKLIMYRPDRPLMLIDLAVPRNVEARTAEIPNVQVFDMDDLQAFAAHAVFSANQDFSHAEAIVAQEVAEYEKLLKVLPFIGDLHKKIEIIRQREVEKTMRYLHHPDDEVCQQIELLSHSLVRKILHEPTMHLRTELDQETLNDYVDALSNLFDLSEGRRAFSLENGEK